MQLKRTEAHNLQFVKGIFPASKLFVWHSTVFSIYPCCVKRLICEHLGERVPKCNSKKVEFSLELLWKQIAQIPKCYSMNFRMFAPAADAGHSSSLVVFFHRPIVCLRQIWLSYIRFYCDQLQPVNNTNCKYRMRMKYCAVRKYRWDVVKIELFRLCTVANKSTNIIQLHSWPTTGQRMGTDWAQKTGHSLHGMAQDTKKALGLRSPMRFISMACIYASISMFARCVWLHEQTNNEYEREKIKQILILFRKFDEYCANIRSPINGKWMIQTEW